ncbi:T9SS C-terminal target domain-containing protein [Paraflavitalea soli]|uniref:T9SS C-terminal target domain-containing protein n=2 Tax=Paraflavitalea soli TaxID=2315862 RepID=A0A3B7MZ91_9BACT|nr:T9SS C-terminal target domain-containing protein [Paraflavitalea soli]
MINDEASLTWKTENEENTNKFIIERSVDGRNFKPVGEVMAYNTSGRHQYNFTDPAVTNLSVNRVHYRLKQVDKDARFIYSKTVMLPLKGKTGMLIYPNPVKDILNLTVKTTQIGQLKIEIIDNSGRLMKQEVKNILPGSNSFSIQTKELTAGVYQLIIKGETIYEIEHFIKQ